MKKKLILLLALALCLTVLAGCGSSSGGSGKTVNLENCVVANFSGMNGMGNLSLGIDGRLLETEMMTAMGEDKYWNNLNTATGFEMSVNATADKTAGLSNGDKITVTVSYSSDLAKSLKFKVGGNKYTLTVAGLQDPIIVDAFDPAYFNTENGVYIWYEGTAPQGSLRVRNNVSGDNPISKATYTFSEAQAVKAGEIVTVTATLNLGDPYTLKSMTGEYVVPAIDRYVQNTSEVTAILPQIKQDVQSMTVEARYGSTIITDTARGMAGDSPRYYGGETCGSVFLLNTQDGYYADTILIPVLFQVVPNYINSPLERGIEHDVYGLLTCSGLKVLADGTVVYDANYKYPNQTMYTNLDTLKNNEIYSGYSYYGIEEIPLP